MASIGQAQQPDRAKDDIVLIGVRKDPVISHLELNRVRSIGGPGKGEAVIEGVAGFEHAGIPAHGQWHAACVTEL